LIATAAPTTVAPAVEVALPSAAAFASECALERSVSPPPALTLSPS